MAVMSASRSRKGIALSLLLIVLLSCLIPIAEAKSNSKNKSPSPSPSSGGTTKKGGGLLWLLLLLFIPGLLLICCVMKMLGCICGGAAAVAKNKQDAKKFGEVKASDDDFLSGKLPGPLLGSAAPVGPGTTFALPGKGSFTLWVGSYQEDGVNNSTNYYINFSPDGSISGSGQDQDGQFSLSGRSDISTGRFVWTEDISNEGVKVAVQLQGLPQGPDGAITRLQGTYCGTTGVFGPLELVASDGQQNVEMTGLGPQHVQVGMQGEAPPQQYGMPPPPAGNYYPPPPPQGYAPAPPAGYPPAGAPPPPAGYPGPQGF